MPFFVALVPRDRYLDANAKLSATRSASFIAGPAVGGALVQVLTAPGAILVDALTFVASAVQIGRVRVVERPIAEAHGHSLLRRAREGLALVAAAPVPSRRASAAPRRSTSSRSWRRHCSSSSRAATLGLSAGVIGLALGVGALGGLVGAVAAPRARRPLRPRPR